MTMMTRVELTCSGVSVLASHITYKSNNIKA